MKKLLLILSAILVSVISLGQSVDPNLGWAYLNPFAYDLKSEVKDNGTIDLIFSLNANSLQYSFLSTLDEISWNFF